MGDSCHATAPTLAQGACLAIEDAAELASCIQQGNNLGESVEIILQRYEKNRMWRAKRVRYIANLLAMIGQLQSNSLITARDITMRVVPEFIKRRVFDATLKISLGGNYVLPKISYNGGKS